MTCGKIDLACTRCRLSDGRTQVVPGTGPCSARVVFIGEGPGKDEDARGEPFIGRAGKVLSDALDKAGVARQDVFITNLVKCRPPGNRRPRKDEVDTCRIYLESELKTVKPAVVCALGQTVANSLLGNKESMATLMRKDWTVKLGGRSVRMIVAYHPAACLYQRRHLKTFQESIKTSLEAAGVP
jgi:uracil-DNA glycosylase family 4